MHITAELVQSPTCTFLHLCLVEFSWWIVAAGCLSIQTYQMGIWLRTQDVHFVSNMPMN